jgi:O-antigen/teichoic acid export membrane protein
MKYFVETKYRVFWDKTLFKTLMNYSGWNLFGNIAGVTMGQGVNILLNIFFNPAVNAARAIAYQVNGAVNGFVSSFQIAMNPQIVKSFAVKDLKYMHQLIFKGSKYSFYLLFFISLPLLIETDIILKIWLRNIPDYSEGFCRLVLISTLVDSISGPVMTAAHATGKIKVYQGVLGGMMLLVLPVSFFFLKFQFPPETTFYISIFFSITAIFIRLLLVSPLIDLSIFFYIKYVIVRITLVTTIALIIPLTINHLLPQGYSRLIIVIILSILTISISIFYVGLDKKEKHFTVKKLKQFFRLK